MWRHSASTELFFLNVWYETECGKGNILRCYHYALNPPPKTSCTPLNARKDRRQMKAVKFIFAFFFFNPVYWLHCAIHIMQFRRSCSGVFGKLLSPRTAAPVLPAVCMASSSVHKCMHYWQIPAWLIARSSRTHWQLLNLKYSYS